MYNYKVIRNLNREEYMFKFNSPTLDIGDPRFLYKCIRNPLKNGTVEDVIKGYPSKKEYLHKKLDKRNFLDIIFFEKHKDDVVFKTDDGEKLTVKNFWEPAINDVHITFLKQLTLQISKYLFQKIPSCINEDTSISFYNHFCIKDNGYSYSAISVQPLEIPEYFLESVSVIIIKWKSKSSEFDYIEMHQEVDEKSIEFMLCDYDEEVKFCDVYFKQNREIVGIIDRLSKSISTKKREGTTNLYSYIDICDLNELSKLNNYPDVVFKFIFNNPVSKNIIKQTEYVISEFINKYNPKNKNKIHDAFYINKNNSKETDNSLLFAVDFGNSNPKVLFEFVEFLEKSKLNISKIQVKN